MRAARVTAFSVRQHLSADSLARIDKAIETSPGRLVPRVSQKKGRAIYIAHDAQHALSAVRMAAIDKLPDCVRVRVNEDRAFGADIRKLPEFRKALGAIKRSKVGRAHMETLALENGRTGNRWGF